MEESTAEVLNVAHTNCPKEPQSNFWLGRRNTTAGIRYWEFKTDPRFFSPMHPRSTDCKLCSIVLPIFFFNLVESGFSWVTYLPSTARHRPDVMKRDDLPLINDHTATEHTCHVLIRSIIMNNMPIINRIITIS